MRAGTALVIVFFAAGAAAAQSPGVQRSESHIEIAPLDNRNPDQLFMDRLKQLKTRSDLSALLDRARTRGGSFDVSRLLRLQDNPELLDRAQQLLRGIDLSDPGVRSMIDRFVRQNRLNIDAGQVLRQLQNLQNQQSDGSGGGGGEAPAALIPKNRGLQRSPNPGGETEENRGAWTRDIMDWAEKFPRDRLAGALRESPALREFMQDLAKGVRFGSMRDGDTLDKQLARWQDRWESLRSWLPNEWPEGLRPNLEGLGPIDVHMPKFEFSTPSSARSAAPILSRLADGLPVLYVAIGALIVFALWKTVRRKSGTLSAAEARELAPVPLEQITSRRQLIRAIDQLAVLRCGTSAKSWNHRTVAVRLPRADSEKPAAGALADAYEWARYSPEEGEPPADVLAAARRNLAALREGAA